MCQDIGALLDLNTNVGLCSPLALLQPTADVSWGRGLSAQPLSPPPVSLPLGDAQMPTEVQSRQRPLGGVYPQPDEPCAFHSSRSSLVGEYSTLLETGKGSLTDRMILKHIWAFFFNYTVHLDSFCFVTVNLT